MSPISNGDAMRALNWKLWRECWQLKGQLLSIALVMATGIMTVVTMRGSYESLVDTQQRYYQDTRFADVWISLRRAPESIRERLAEIPGVALVDTRVTLLASLDIDALDEPATARFVSIPDHQRPLLNDLVIRNGRYIEAGAGDEIIINEKFAAARGLQPGDSLRAIINGRARDLQIVGTGISPEYAYATPPGALYPDNERFAVIWMGRPALGPAYDMDGAFNEAVFRLAPEANELAVITRLNEELAAWGGFGAYGRAQQTSHLILDAELDQNRVMGTVIPLMFLAVAVFLLHLVLSRMITTQRGEIAVLKAFGYSDLEVGMHFLMFALVAALLGTTVGALGGYLLGDAYIQLYTEYFDLPGLSYRLSPALLLLSVLISVGGACTGALTAVRKAVRLPPAEAMRPEPPASFRPGWMERIGLGRLLSASGRMILRNIERKPVQSLLSSLGVALSLSILIVGSFMFDGVTLMMDLQFRQIQREDVAVTFMENQPDAVRHELAGLPGVQRVEGWRSSPARFQAGHLSRDIAITGIARDSELRRIVSANGQLHPLTADGLVISRYLAEQLQLRSGDRLQVSLLEGQRRSAEVTLAGVVDDFMGVNAYMDLTALERLSGESGLFSGAWLLVEESSREALFSALKQRPTVAGATAPETMLASFEAEMAEAIYIALAFLIGFASVIAFGVIYNGARISLSERGRELASLRVMGFHRREVTFLLLGEQALITLIALPLGALLGYLMAWAVVASMVTEAFRVPLVVNLNTWLQAILIILLAAALSSLAVRRRLHRYDLISVLKTRE